MSDGVTPDVRITTESYDQHCVELAPPVTFMGDYYKQQLPWKKFEQRFNAHLQGVLQQSLMQEVVECALVGDVTLLCIEDGPECCHRRLVAEACKRLVPHLDLHIC